MILMLLIIPSGHANSNYKKGLKRRASKSWVNAINQHTGNTIDASVNGGQSSGR